MVEKTALYRAVEDREAEIVEFVREFLGVETENPPGRNYREGATFLADALTDRGYQVDLIEVPDQVVAEHYPDRTAHDRVNVMARKIGRAHV